MHAVIKCGENLRALTPKAEKQRVGSSIVCHRIPYSTYAKFIVDTVTSLGQRTEQSFRRYINTFLKRPFLQSRAAKI
jgi:hypothetical protein